MTTSIHEVRQVMFVETEHGKCQVLFIMDYGIHENTIWVCVNKEGEVRHYNTTQFKLGYNHTLWENK